MAGLKDTIELDIDAALASIGRLDNALDQAARAFKVELSRSVDVLRSIDVPPVDVDVVVDSAGAQAAIDAAVSDTSVAVDVDVDGTDDLLAADRAAEQLGDEVERTGEEAKKAERQFDKVGVSLKKAFAIVGVAGAIAAIRKTVDAASDLEESQSKANVVFGESVGVIDKFASTSATAVGLSKQAALGFAGTFGNLFVALGISASQAAGLSTEIVSLGADLASFNNLEVDETLEKLRSGLVGEVEPLRALGINFNAAQVEAKAFALGLTAVGEQASEAAKVQARYALIVEQTGTAQGDFARTSGGLANQQRILVAELQDAAAVIGAQLLPVILDLVSNARDDLVPALIELASSAVPAFVGALEGGVPILLTTLDVLVALTPIIKVIGEVIDALPAPLVTAAATFGLLGAGLGPLPSLFGAMSRAAVSAGGGLAGLSAATSTLLGPIGLVTIALGVGLATWSAHQKEQERNRKAVEDATKAFLDQTVAIDERTEALTRARVETSNQEDDLQRLGVSIEEFDAIARQGGSAIEEFIDRALRADEIGFRRGGIDSAAEGIREYGSAAELAANGITGNVGLIKSLTELDVSYRKGAKAAIQAKIATGEITFAHAMEVVERNRAKDGTIDYIRVQEILESQLARSAAAETARAEAQRIAYEAQFEFKGQLQEAAAFLAEGAEKVEALTRAEIEAVDPTGVLTDRFRAAGVTVADLAVLAEATGLSLESLIGIEKGVAEETQEFVDTVRGGIEGLQAALGEIKEDDSLDSFIANYTQKLADANAFLTGIAELQRRGADDLAASLLTAGEVSATAVQDALALGDEGLAERERQIEKNELQEQENLANAERLGRDLVEAQSNTNRDLGDLPPPDLVGPYAIGAGEVREEVEKLHKHLIEASGPIGEDFNEGLARGLNSTVQRVADAASGVGGTIIKFTNSAIGATSPSKEAIKIGGYFVDGIVIGLDDTGKAERAAARLGETITEAVARFTPPPVVVDVVANTETIAAAEVEKITQKALGSTDFLANFEKQFANLVGVFDDGTDVANGAAEVLDNIFGNTGKLIPVVRTNTEQLDNLFGVLRDGVDVANGFAEVVDDIFGNEGDLIKGLFDAVNAISIPDPRLPTEAEWSAIGKTAPTKADLWDAGILTYRGVNQEILDGLVRTFSETGRSINDTLQAVVPAFTAASVAPPPVVVGASAGAGIGGAQSIVVQGPMFDGVTIDRGVEPLHVFAEARQQLVEVSVPSA